ncbi:MAG: putative Ig domain-containing protein [Bacteroidetes bacterium]|nr:putative Ig domain-containing protein [Bacteroidota bacterium]
MKQSLYFFILVMIIGCQIAEPPKNPVISFNQKWKFITGDRDVYKSPEFDDSEWMDIEMDKIWEQQGYDPYDGYAWFRTRIVIPSYLKDNSFLQDSLRIFLGKINNFDQSFLNGFIIGVNGKNMPADAVLDTNFIHAPTNYWDLERRYTLSADDPRILWDRENVFAIRVYDEGGQGGMYTGNQELSMTSVMEYLKFDNNNQPFDFEGQNLSKSFSIKNNSKSLTLNGYFTIEARGKLDEGELYHLNENLTLSPGESKSYHLVIRQLEQSAKITYGFDFEDANQSIILEEESPYMLTPIPGQEPQINGPGIYGARPGNPFLYAIPASGLRPMTYQVEGLPKGLKLNKNNGIITGSIKKTGIYDVILKVENDLGKDQKSFQIVIGDKIALTPPLGWNSWNCWGLSVDTEKAIASAKMFKQKGLADHGWSYINLDDGWEIPKDQEPKRDPSGKILTNEKFPDMKALGDSIHVLGLKFGIYSSPGPYTCGGYTASYQHELQDAQSFADWGVDYLKYDWCSYEQIANDHSLSELKKPYFLMRDCLDKVNRDIVYSLCQYGMGEVWTWGEEVGGNLWRTTGDITDTWESLSSIGFGQVGNAPYAGPGHWNDPDMLIVGWVGWGPNLHPTRLTPDEQYTHISLWSLLSAPMLIGCDLERLDAFTLNLLTNDEVLAVHQDILGKQAIPVIKTETMQVWVKELAGGNKAVGIFNLGDQTEKFNLLAEQIGINGTANIHDLWRQRDVGSFGSAKTFLVPSHGVVLIKVIP